jgi:hypothetical protein
MRNYPNIRNNGINKDIELKPLLKQDLKTVDDLYFLDEVGDYHGTQYEKFVYESDGIDTKITSPHITNQTVVSKKGTASLTIVTGEIQISAGWVTEIELSDGTLYRCEEQQGTVAYDASGNGNHGTLLGNITHFVIRDKSLINYTNEAGYSKGIVINENEDVVDTGISTTVDKISLYLQTNVISSNQIVIGYNDSNNPTYRNIIIDEGKISVNFDGVNKRNTLVVSDNKLYKVIVDYVNKSISVNDNSITEISTKLISTYNSSILIGGGEDIAGNIFSSNNSIIVIHPKFTNGVTDIEYEGSDIAIQNRTIAKYTDISNTQMIDSIGVRDGEIFKGSCYNFDGVNDKITIITANNTISEVSGIDMNGEVVSLFINYVTDRYEIIKEAEFDGKVYNIKCWNFGYTPTESEKLSFGLENNLFAWFKCDEGDGTTAFDSSGNENHGTITNATLSTFHTTDAGIAYSWKNQVGYSEGVNLLRYSEQFDDWVKVGITVTPNVALAPNGTLTADKLIATNSPSQTRAAYRATTVTQTATYTLSARFKAAEYSRCVLQEIGSARFGATFDLVAVTTTSLGGTGFVSSNIIAEDDGWFLCYVVFNGIAGANYAITTIGYTVGASLNTAGTSYAGDGVSGIYVWGAQLELGTTVTDYQKIESLPTAGALIPRNELNPTKDILGNDLQHVGLVKMNADLVDSNCANFDGVNDYGIVDNPIDTKQSFSFGGYIKFTNQSNRGGIFYRNTTSFNGANIGLNSASGVDCRVSDGTNAAAINLPIQLGTLAFYGITWNATTKTLKAYNASGLVGTNTNINVNTSILDTSAEYRLMSRSAGEFVAGQIAMLFQSQSVLTDEEMLALANKQVVSGVEIYPLAEGKGTISYAREDSSKFITWNNITESTFWSTQDVYHSNIIDGFSEGINKFSYSEDLTNTYWGSFRLTKTNIGEIEGIQLTNCEATEDNTNGGAITKGISDGYSVVGTYTMSVYARASDGDFLLLRPSDNADFNNRAQAWFDLSTGTVAAVSAPGVSFDSATSDIELIGSGLYRCSVTFTINTNIANLSCRFYVVDGDNSNSVTIGTSIDMGGVQLERDELTAYQQTTSSPTEGQKLPYKINGVYTNPAGEWHNKAETKLLAPQAPSLLEKFVHGGTFGGTHYVTTNTALNATSSYDITLNLKDITVTNCNIIDARDGSNDGIVFWYVNSVSTLRFVHNTTTVNIQTSGIDDGKYRFTWDGSIVSIYKDGVLIDSQSDSSSISTASNLRIGSRNFISSVNNVIGRISGVKVIADGVTIVDEPLNGTFNDVTLTGDASTFWVEEYNNLLFDSSGVPIPYNPYDIGNDYLGLGAMFSEELISNQLNNIIIAPFGYSEYEEITEDLDGNDIIIPIVNNNNLDVTGETAMYDGKVAADMKLINSNCINSNGISVEGVFNFDCTGLTLVSYQGTAEVTLDSNNDKLIIGQGTVYNVVLSNGYHFPFAEGLGTVSYHALNSEKRINWTNITWTTQNDYHYNINNGFTKGVNKIDYSEDFNQWSTNFAPKSEFLTSGFTDPLGGNKAFRINNSLGQNFTLQRPIANVANHTISMWIKTYDGSTITRSLLYGNNLANGYQLTITPVWQRFSYSTPSTGNSNTWGIYSIAGEVDILIAFAQMEEGVMTNYQATFGSVNKDVKLPYKINKVYSNPAINGHNGAETDFTMEVFREELGDSFFHYEEINTNSNVVNYPSIIPNVNNTTFSTVLPNEKKNIITLLPKSNINKLLNYKIKQNGFHKNINSFHRDSN